MKKAAFVAERTVVTAMRASSVLAIVSPNAPSAPAFDTAIASSGLVVLPWGASKDRILQAECRHQCLSAFRGYRMYGWFRCEI